MMYSSKQKLAMAMAAAMAVSVVPAMSFAAPQDLTNVIDALGKEDVKKAQAPALDPSSAEAVLMTAKGLVNGDAQAQLVIDAYQASIDIFKAVDVADWTAKKAAYDAAVTKLTFLDVTNSFKAKQTDDNHLAVKTKLENPVVVTADYEALLSWDGTVVLRLNLKNATVADVTEVKLNGAVVPAGDWAAALDGDGNAVTDAISVNTTLKNLADVTEVKLTAKGTEITVPHK